jgi:hypothetical protein
MSTTQPTLFDDPTIAHDERELFGDQLRPERMCFDAQGDYLHGFFVGVERDVDLKTGFAPIDIWTFEAISGVHKAGTVRLQTGRLYAVAVLSATLKNRLAEINPAVNPRERMAIRRDRDFTSTVGESAGKTLVAYQTVMPDRAALGDEPEKATEKGAKAAK